jgi:hypothetical protein
MSDGFFDALSTERMEACRGRYRVEEGRPVIITLMNRAFEGYAPLYRIGLGLTDRLGSP